MDAVDFPPVISPMTDTMSIDKLEQQVSELQKLSLHFCARNLVIVAEEIWELSMGKKQAVESREGKHLYDLDDDLAEKAAEALGMPNKILEVKKIAQKCIIAGDNMSHFASLQALEDAVKSSETAIMYFPVLRQSHPHHCTTIDHYWRMKQLLSESFKDA